MNDQYKPQEGDIIQINFDPQAGNEPGSVLEALVVSPSPFSQTGFAFIVPITAKAEGFSDDLAIPVPSSCRTQGRCLTWQLKSFDYVARGATFVEKAPKSLLNNVRQVIQSYLGT